MAQRNAIYSQVHIPTGVTHCAAAFLTQPPVRGSATVTPDLIVVRSTAIDVYSIRPLAGDPKLSLRGRSPLWGVVESLAVLRGGSGQRDALLLTFRESKLSIVQWDPSTCELSPSGLHFFEGDPALKAGRTLFPTPPLALTDPKGRCAAVVMYRHQLAVLPAVLEESLGLSFLDALDAMESDPLESSRERAQGRAGGGSVASLGNSYVDNLAKAGVKEVRDAVFLHGYNEPVLLLLHEEDPTWAGNLRTKKDTCCLSALSLNLSSKRHPRIWAVQHLPADAYRLVAVPSGGALVLCKYCVLYYSQGKQTGVVVNSLALGTEPPPPPLAFDSHNPSATAIKYAQEYAYSTHPDTVFSAVQYCDKEAAASLALDLDGAHATWLTLPVSASSASAQQAQQGVGGKPDPKLLLALRSGQLALVGVEREGGGGVRRLTVSKIGAAPPAAGVASLGGGLFFLGSHQGDSLLVRATPAVPAARMQLDGSTAGASSAPSETPAQQGDGMSASDAGGAAAAAPAAAEVKAEEKEGGGEREGAGTVDPLIAVGDEPPTSPSTADPASGATATEEAEGAGAKESRGRSAADPLPAGATSAQGDGHAGESPSAASLNEEGGEGESPPSPKRRRLEGEGGGDGREGAGGGSHAGAGEEGGDGREGAGGRSHAEAGEEGGDAGGGDQGKDADGTVAEYMEDDEEKGWEERGNEDYGANEEYDPQLVHAFASDSDEELLIYGEALESAAGAPTDADVAAGAGAGTASGVAGAKGEGQPGLKLVLKIVDSLVNIGPLRHMAVGGLGSADYPPYLVTCGGRERGGALCMLRQHVVPDVITEVPLPGVVGVWAVHQRSDDDEGGEAEGEGFHSYLLISFPGSTKVLATGEELQEVTDSLEFAADTTTIAAGSVCQGRRVVQVFPQGVRILAGGEVLQDFWTADLAPNTAGAAGPSILSASLLDPYVLVVLSDGTARILESDPSSGQLALVQHADNVLCTAAAAGTAAAQQQHITACCLTRDPTRLLGGGEGGSSSGSTEAVYCVLCRGDGSLEVYRLPGWQQVFLYRNLGEGHRVMEHGGGLPPAMEVPGVLPAKIVEVRLEAFGGEEDTPALPPLPGSNPTTPGPPQLTLLALTSEDTLLVYHAFRTPQGSLAFRKADHLDLPPSLPPAVSPEAGAAGGGEGEGAVPPPRVPRLLRFDALGEDLPCWGFVVTGSTPLMLVAGRGTLFPHPLYLPSGLALSSFTPFHNVNCPQGFIMSCVGGEGRGSLCISQLPPRTRLDCPWPRSKVPLRATPLRVTHYPEADLFAVLTSRQVPFKPFLPEEENGEPNASFAYALAEAAAKEKGTMEGHEVRLIDPGTWSTAWRYSMLPGERALAVRAVHLRDSTTGNTVPLIAVGTAFAAGEDYPVLGRVVLFRVHRKEGGGEGDGSLAAAAATLAGGGWKASMVFSRDFRGPIAALGCLEGYLLISVGNRIETLALATSAPPQQAAGPEGGDAPLPSPDSAIYKFTRAAFFDGPSLVTSMNVVKNFVLLGDVQRSVQFVRYKDEGRQLSLLSKDFNRADITSTEFIINGSSLHMACGDGGGVLRMLSYVPNNAASWRGQKLMPWGAFQLGDPPLCMLRTQLRQVAPGDKSVRQAVLVGDGVGSLGMVAPVARADSASLLKAVQRELTTALRHTAGLNPASFRVQHASLAQSMHGARWFGQPLSDAGVLDGELLVQYRTLSRGEQYRVAQAAGSTREHVLQLLAETVLGGLVF